MHGSNNEMTIQTPGRMIMGPLLFLKVSNDALQLSSLFLFHGLEYLSRTLWLTRRRLSSQRLTILLDKGVLILSRAIKQHR